MRHGAGWLAEEFAPARLLENSPGPATQRAGPHSGAFTGCSRGARAGRRIQLWPIVFARPRCEPVARRDRELLARFARPGVEAGARQRTRGRVANAARP